MEQTTDLAIIGYGYMGHIYKQAALGLSRRGEIERYYKYDLPDLIKAFNLKAVVDISFDKSWFCETEGIWYCGSVASMLSNPEISVDSAIVAVPTKDHFAISRELIQAGISLLIEKPVCQKAEQINELIQLAKERGVRIMPGHVERYNPVTLDALEAVQFGMYGDPTGYALVRTSSRPERVTDNLIIDKLIHDIDLVQCLFGSFEVVAAEFRKDSGTVAECKIHTRHPSGLCGSIFSSWLVEEKHRVLSIDFQRGSFKGDLVEKTVHIDRYMEFSKTITGYRNNQIKDQLGDFIAYKCLEVKTLVNIQDALSSAYIIDEISRRAEE